MKCAQRLCVRTLVVALGAAALHASDNRQRIDSRWRDRDIAVDGNQSEWPGPLVRVDDKVPVSVAAMNDGQFLYLVLSASDPAARMQILRQGLILWFDPKGADKKHFGLKFPVGVPLEEIERGRDGRERRSQPSGTGEAADLEVTDRLEVYGPRKGDGRSFVSTMAPGIAVKIGLVEGFLVYELKIPIQASSDLPYGIEAKPGALIGFGLETPKMDKPEGEGRSGGLGGMGGRGRGMGGGGGGGARGGGRGGVEPPKPLKTWAIDTVGQPVTRSRRGRHGDPVGVRSARARRSRSVHAGRRTRGSRASAAARIDPSGPTARDRS